MRAPARRPMPSLIWTPQPCPQCGSMTLSEAEDKCTATQQMSGEYECPGAYAQESDTGQLLFPSPESAVALDEWYDEQGRLDDAEEDARVLGEISRGSEE